MTADVPGRSMAMHQPNFLPWIGYFYKMRLCDVFVYLDSVQYPRGRSFSARTKIKGPNGAMYLTVPVSVRGEQGKALYTEVQFADDKWREKHVKTLSLNYRKAPYFQEIMSLIEPSLREATCLVDLNIRLIDALAQYLSIETKRVRLSALQGVEGSKSSLIVNICKALGANTYVSGTGGGKEYNDEALLCENEILLRYSDFDHPTYQQLWGEFESHLSMIDLVFNLGREARHLIGPRAGTA